MQRWRDLKVVGIDGAPQMLAVAAGEPSRATGVSPSPVATGVPARYALGCDYSGIVSNSLLHHLHDPQVLWQTLPQLKLMVLQW